MIQKDRTVSECARYTEIAAGCGRDLSMEEEGGHNPHGRIPAHRLTTGTIRRETTGPQLQ